MTDELDLRELEIGPGLDDGPHLDPRRDDYAGLARLLDALLDDAQSEPTDNDFLEAALRRFGQVRSQLDDEQCTRTAYPKRDQATTYHLLDYGAGKSHFAAAFNARFAAESAAWAVTDGSSRSVGIDNHAQLSIYTRRNHSELDHSDLEREMFSVVEAARSNAHTTPDFDNAHVLLKKIATSAHTCGIFTAEVAAYIESAKNRRHAGHLQEAEQLARKSLKISQAHEFRRSTILAHIELGMLSGDDTHLNHAAELVELTDIELNARLFYAFARSRSQVDPLSAIAFLVQSEIMYEAAGDSFGLARAKARLGSHLRQLGNFTAARHHLEEALILARRGGFKRVEGYVLLDLADIHRLTGQDYKARDLLQSAMDIFLRMGHIGGRARALVGFALMEVRARKSSHAGVAYAEEATFLYKKLDNVQGRGVSASTALALRCLGGSLRDLDVDEDEVSRTERLARAGQCLDDAIAAYRALRNRDGEALCLVGKAKLVACSATPKAALPLAMQALEILAEIPGRFWLGTDSNIIEGFHSWCYRDTLAIAVDCNDFKGAQTALLAGEVDKELRELRAELVLAGGELGDAVQQLVLVELMMHSPAHEPNLGPHRPHHPKPVTNETRQKVLQKIEELDPHVARRLRHGSAR